MMLMTAAPSKSKLTTEAGRFSLESFGPFGFNVPMIFGTRFISSHRQTLAALACVSFLAACESTNGNKDGGVTAKGNIVIRDQNNYTATSTLTIPRVQTAPGADLTIDWSDMAKDFLCHAITPSDIGNVAFVKVKNHTESDIENLLGSGQSFASDATPRSYRTSKAPGVTNATLSEFASDPTTTPLTGPVVPATDYQVVSNSVYLLLFATGTVVGSGSKSMLFLEPTAGSAVTTVSAVGDSCAANILDFKADITTPAPVSVSATGPTWTVDWSQITRDGLGNSPVYFTDIDELQLGYYDQYTVATLQQRFLDLDRIATLFYELPVADGATSVDLSAAVSATDGKFAGFTRTNGVWAVALRCSTCSVPAPIAVAILSPS